MNDLCKITFLVVVLMVAVSVVRTTFTTIVIGSLLEVTRSPAIFRLVPLFEIEHVLFLGLLHHCIRQTKEFYVVSTYVNLLQLVELLPVVVVVDDVCQGKIHPRIAVAQLAENGFAIF